MLFDGAIRFLREAAKEIGEKNIPAKLRLLQKVERIIDYLQSCLDKEKGGEIAGNLDRLYDYMLVRLTEANLHNDVNRIEEIADLMGTIRQGWATLCEGAKKEEGVEPPEEGKTPAGHKNIRVSV